jgi:hypothetical protein
MGIESHSVDEMTIDVIRAHSEMSFLRESVSAI